MKPQELGAALKGIAESHATKRDFGDSCDKPARELDYSRKGGMISLDDEGAKRVSQLTKELIQDRPKIADLCTLETVRFEIVEVVKKLVHTATPLDPSKEADELIKRLSGTPCRFVFVFPIIGGRIEEVMTLNRSILVPSLPMVPAALASGFQDVVKVPVKDLEIMIHRERPPMPPPELINVSPREPDWYVITTSLALDKEKAEEKALHTAEEDLGLLRLRILKSRQPLESALQIEVVKDSVFTIKMGMGLGAAMEVLSCETYFLPSGLIEIPDLLDFYIHDASTDFTKITGILNAHNMTRLQERVYLAYTWLNKALKQRDPRERLLDSVIGMEALLLRPRESRGDALAERVAFCLGHDYSSRKRIFDGVRDLVGMRNRVSHEGETNVVGDQADSATRILSNILEVVTERCDRESTIDDFIKEVETKKFS